MDSTKNEYKFEVTPKPGTANRFTVALRMSQDEFEDHHFKRAAVHACIESHGLNSRDAVWMEAPDVDRDIERLLREAIGCAPSSQLIAYYPHGWHHTHYKSVVVKGATYRYMAFQNGHFIKYAPDVAMAQEAA